MNSIDSVFEAFSRLNVLIIGDVMVDAYVWGEVSRISPEAPVPVMRIDKEEQRLGGAANVAGNVQALGARPILCSVIGDDINGKIFEEILQKRGLDKKGIIKSNNRVTTVKKRLLSGSQHLLRVDREFEVPLNRNERNSLVERAEMLLSQADVLIFEDYDKGVLNKTAIREIMNMAGKRGIPVVVDPKKKNFMSYKGAALFKPNIKEIAEGLKVELDAGDEQALAEAVTVLRKKLDLKYVLITRSERGVYMDAGEKKLAIPAHVRAISDVSGAGDTVVSTAALCLALGLPPEFIAGLSNLAGGLVCEHLGVVPVNKEQLFHEAVKNGLKI